MPPPLDNGARVGGDERGGRVNGMGGIGLPCSVVLVDEAEADLTGDIGRWASEGPWLTDDWAVPGRDGGTLELVDTTDAEPDTGVVEAGGLES